MMSGEDTMTSIENKDAELWRDQNLMIIYAVEGYAHRHNMTTREAHAILKKYGITSDIRKHYEALHTQDPDEFIVDEYYREKAHV